MSKIRQDRRCRDTTFPVQSQASLPPGLVSYGKSRQHRSAFLPCARRRVLGPARQARTAMQANSRRDHREVFQQGTSGTNLAYGTALAADPKSPEAFLARMPAICKISAAYAPAEKQALRSALEVGTRNPAIGAGGRSPARRAASPGGPAARPSAAWPVRPWLPSALVRAGCSAREARRGQGRVSSTRRAEANWTLPWHQDKTVALAPRPPRSPGFTRWSRQGRRATMPRRRWHVLEHMLAVRVHLDDCDAGGPGSPAGGSKEATPPGKLVRS